MRIVTYIHHDESDDVQAMTKDEFRTNATFDEWVWHDAPNKQAAIDLHDVAFDSYMAGEFTDTYQHKNKESN